MDRDTQYAVEMTITISTYDSQKTYVYKSYYYDKEDSAEDIVNTVAATAVQAT